MLLERMGLSPADLAAVPQPCLPVPTFAEYVPVVSAAVSAGTRRAYSSYWNRVIEHWGGRRLPTTRRALPDARLAEINQVAATTGDDPELDTLILRLHAETADAAARWRCACGIWTRSRAWSCCGRRARRCAGSRSPRP